MIKINIYIFFYVYLISDGIYEKLLQIKESSGNTNQLL